MISHAISGKSFPRRFNQLRFPAVYSRDGKAIGHRTDRSHVRARLTSGLHPISAAAWGGSHKEKSPELLSGLKSKAVYHSRARASLRNRHHGPSSMGFEDEVEQSFDRICPRARTVLGTRRTHRQQSLRLARYLHFPHQPACIIHNADVRVIDRNAKLPTIPILISSCPVRSSERKGYGVVSVLSGVAYANYFSAPEARRSVITGKPASASALNSHCAVAFLCAVARTR